LNRSKKEPANSVESGQVLSEYLKDGLLKIIPQDGVSKSIVRYLRAEISDQFYSPKVSGWKQLLPRFFVRRVNDNDWSESIILDLSSIMIPDEASA
jgi:hypothetical protein